jgi:hypothetical protein
LHWVEFGKAAVTTPPPRQYYSHRHGLHQDSLRLTLDQLKELFLVDFKQFNRREYFQESFGYICVDTGEKLGTVGDAAAFFLRRLHRPGLWPVPEAVPLYSEHDLFDVIELLYDLISRPDDGSYHSHGDCGWHYNTFDQAAGRLEYRTKLNEILADYTLGYELSINGEIRELGETGQRSLVAAELPSLDPERVDAKIEAAKSSFLRYGASLEDRRHAVQLLADALEFLRPQLSKVITRKDEDVTCQVIHPQVFKEFTHLPARRSCCECGW